MKRASQIILVLLCAYLCVYGLVRWRKILVMHEYRLKEEKVIVRSVGVGWDCRDNWIGKTKNGLAPWIYRICLPLACCENQVRGGRRKIL